MLKIKNTKNIKTILTKRGYAIVKKCFTFIELETLRTELKVKPYVNEDYGPGVEPYPIYLESENKIYIPKHIGYEKFGEPDKIKCTRGIDIDIEFSGTLRDKQKPIIDSFLKTCEEGPFQTNSKGGIISVPCGWGKTIMALYLISKLKKKTIIVVHKEFLLNQWKKRIEEFLPGARVGIIQASKVDVTNKDIVIGMLQSLSSKEYDIDTVFGDFGFTIIDECHHIAAEVFSRSLPKINSYYSLGLSATPKRADGLSKVFESYLGPTVYKVTTRDDKIVKVNVIKYNDKDNTEYNTVELSAYGKVCVPKMINNIVSNRSRNTLIICILQKLLEVGHQVLVLSDRRVHLTELHDMASTFTTVGYYVGGMKQKDLDISETKNIILGTYPMSSEGLDIPTLSAVVFTTPKSSIEQSIGRITRRKHKSTPIAYDIVDNLSVFPNQYKKRLRVYKKLEYEVEEQDIHVNQHTDKDNFIYQLEQEATKIDFKRKSKNKVQECCEIVSDGD